MFEGQATTVVEKACMGSEFQEAIHSLKQSIENGSQKKVEPWIWADLAGGKLLNDHNFKQKSIA